MTPEERKIYNAQYWAAHAEQRNAHTRQYRREHPEIYRGRYARLTPEQKARRKEYARKWSKTPKNLEYNRDYMAVCRLLKKLSSKL